MICSFRINVTKYDITFATRGWGLLLLPHPPPCNATVPITGTYRKIDAITRTKKRKLTKQKNIEERCLLNYESR